MARFALPVTTALAFYALAGCIFVTDFDGLDDGARAPVDGGEAGAESAAGDALPAEGHAPFSCEGALLCDAFNTGDSCRLR